ncbi:MAG: OmpA family protein [Gammaproteobacteria bacterium]
MLYGTRTQKTFTLAAVVLTATASSAVSAQSESQQPLQEARGYVFVLPHYLSADANRRGTSEDGRGMAVGYGHPLSERWSWEVQTFADLITVQPATSTDYYRYGAGVDMKYRFRRGDGASPFVLVGAGLLHNDVAPPTADATDVFANVGLGFMTGALGKSELRLRTEVRYMRDRFETGFLEGEKNDRRFSLGVQIPLGRREVVREVEREVVRERVVTQTVPAEIVDTDHDGVPDQNDRCPGTLEGLATDNRGCAATSRQSSVRLDGVTFEFNSAQLTASASETLRRVADALRGEPNLRAEIAGHTDSVGSDEYNLKLSQDRANSVQQFLVAQGIDRGRLQARGYGEGRPVADNGSADGRDRNRRVEFVVLN